jgi:hypothetical protein
MPANRWNADYLRVALIALAGLSAAPGASAQTVSSDPVVQALPLDRWLAEGDQAHIRWNAHVLGTELSNHQRLRARIEIEVDGNELVKRKGNGYLVMIVQFNDDQDRAYQTHKALDLSQVEDAAGKTNITYTQDALVKPGEYRVTLGIFVSATGEHSVSQRKLSVNPIKNDPLPAAWRDLPSVEILRDVESPDNLFLPYAAGKLNLPLETRHPVRVELLVNASPAPSGPNPRTAKATNQAWTDLIPALKVISQISVINGALNVSMLDLTRRQVVFEQNGVKNLSWRRLRSALVTADPNVIDVHSLENRGQNAQFFVDQVGQRITGAEAPEAPSDPSASGGPVPVLIVLSGPMTLNSGEDLRPIKAANRPAGGIYYIRYHSVSMRTLPSSPLEEPRRGRRGSPTASPTPAFTEPLDSLERTLKPLQPRVFDIYTPEQFRKAGATLMSEISRL